MSLAQRPLAARVLHWLFEASLAIKGLLCSAEFMAGLGLLVTPNVLVAKLVFWLRHYEIADNPDEPMVTWTKQALDQFPVHVQSFYGWYLLAHGGLKLAMVVMLWLRILWAYPAAMVVLAGFVVYQVTSFVHSGSPFLIVLSIFDMFMIGLVWQEYRALKTAMAADQMAGA